ncbi:MAG: zinc-dependent metalloprotease [Bacteroidota bacterium]
MVKFERVIKTLGYVSLCMLMLLSIDVNAQKKKKKGKSAEKTKNESGAKKSDEKKIEDLVKSSSKIEGLFTLYQDTIKGTLQMLITEDHLENEYIYFSQIANGVTDARSFTGAYRGSKIFKIEKYFNRLEFVTQNTSSYFDPENALAKAADANISRGIMATETILAHDKEKGHYLIKADDLFLKETLSQVKPPKLPKQPPTAFSLGSLDKNKTKVRNIRNYPENTDLEVEYVYSKPSVLNGGSRAVTDGRNVSIKIYHSIIAMPENDYEVRFDDPRVGYFHRQVTDMTSKSVTPYKDLIHRWHLKKKDPSTKLSEPVEPITWWIENTTPEEIRPIIKTAAEQWNKSFEAAGFKNAMVVKIQPDDADWDAGDIRYNVLRWTASPNPPFGGYGPSFVNPRTGQILGADIMLEYSSLTRNLLGEEVFAKAAFYSFEAEDKLMEYFSHDPHFCSVGQFSKQQNLFGLTAMDAFDAPELEKSKMVNEFIHFLILHEIGHTLGLNHNMKSSQLRSIEELNNEELTSSEGLYGSVMDYPSINYAADRNKQGQYWTTSPGPYDDWAIEFGYREMSSEAEMKKILDRSTEPALFFGNDADDMRAPGKAIDPRVNVGDLSNQAVDYAIERIKLSREVTGELVKKFSKEGQSYHEMLTAYFVATGQQFSSANTISRYVGGVYVDRAFIGQPGATKPFTPVETSDQKKAMQALNKYIFAPDAFSVPENLRSHLQIQRRGYNFFSFTEDPKFHARMLGMQRGVLRHLLHYNTLQRIVDSELYGNDYSIGQVMTDLNNGIFKSDIYGNVNSFRQNLQVEYTKMLISILNGKDKNQYNHQAISLALYNLKQIKKMASGSGGNIVTKAHKEHLKTLVDNAIEEVN